MGFFGRAGNFLQNHGRDIADVVGGLAGGRAEGQQTDITNQQNQALRELMAWQAQQQAEQQRAQLGGERAQFERDSPNVRFGQAMRGNFAANAQDATVDVPDRVRGSLVTYGGGLRPSAFGEGGRAAGRQLAEIGSSRMGQDTFELPTVSQAPRPAGLPQDNWFDKFLEYAGYGAAGAGALGGGRGQ